MARYIDADELRRRVKEKTNPYGKPTLDYESGVKVLNMIDNAPTADVVPKSEYEDLKLEYAGFEGATKQIFEGLKQSNIEVAEQIFEDIENIIDTEYNKHIFGDNDLDDLEHEAIMNFSDDISSDLEKLKKKYTESEEN